MPVSFTLDNLASVLPAGGRTLIGLASGESLALADAVMAAGDRLGAMTFTGAFVPGTNNQSYLANPQCRVESFFITPALKAAGDAVTFLPMCYADVLARLQTIRIDAALFMVTPPDKDGLCSFGPAVDFISELWPRIPVRIAHINPMMPRTHGHQGIPLQEITAYVEADQPFDTPADKTDDPIANQIAAHVIPWIGDGATLQMGIGKIPGAVLRALTGRRNLRFHSGLIVDEVVDLAEAGALAPGAAVLAGVAIGSERLYRAISSDTYAFQPVSITHNPLLIGAIPNFVALNSALEVDLLGQVYSELSRKGLMSGPGGASDYARAARLSKGGLRIIALPAAAAGGRISRIVPPGNDGRPVSLGRMDVDLIVTEHGLVDIREKTYDERAAALIEIAIPAHRAALGAGWEQYRVRLQSG
jgi:acyl-CoA hydrolase